MGFLTKPPLCGSFELRLPDGLLSRYFCWDDIAGRWLRPDLIDSETARKGQVPLQAGHTSSTTSDFIGFIMRAAPATNYQSD
jgi:hypothetical protein